MADYKLYYNNKYIKNINIPKYNLNDWVIAYSYQNGINWYNTKTEDSNIIVTDITSEKKFKLVYSEK